MGIFGRTERKGKQQMIIEYTPQELEQLSLIGEKYTLKYQEITQKRSKETAEDEKKLIAEMDLLFDQYNTEEKLLRDKFEKARFDTLKGDKNAILANAKEQIPLILKSEYEASALAEMTEEDAALFANEVIGIYNAEQGKFLLYTDIAIEYIKEELTLHINALKSDEAALRNLLKIIRTGAESSPYTIDKGKIPTVKPQIAPIPNGESLAFLFKVLNIKNDRIPLEQGKNRNNIIRSMLNENLNALRYTSENKRNNTSIEITISQADAYLKKSRKTTEKILTYVLQTMTAQHYPSNVRLFLSDLVDAGLYSTTSNAKRGIIEFFEQQKLITLKGTVKKNRETVVEKGGILFYSYTFDKGKGIIDLRMNEEFNIDFIANYYSIFPRFAYSLKNNNAFTLVRYIFYIARQRTREIKKSGSFNIKLDAIRENLGLPSVSDVKNRKYKQFIIDPIEKAIEEIEEALQNIPEAQDRSFTITPIVDENANINEWLEGYIEVGISGEFAKSFISIADKAEADRKKWDRKKIKENAVK